MARRRPLFFSFLIVLAYALCGWLWFGSGPIGLVGSIIFIPLVFAFGAGYGGGDSAFWLALLGQLFLIWLLVYSMIRTLPRSL